MLTPENCIPVDEYTTENYNPREIGYDDKDKTEVAKDEHLMYLMKDLDEIKDLEDVRPFLHQKYNIRQLLKNAKLI